MIYPVFLFRREDDKYIVKTVKQWDYRSYDATWMHDPTMGSHPNGCMVPDVDIQDQVFIFNDEQEALKKVAELYAAQLS